MGLITPRLIPLIALHQVSTGYYYFYSNLWSHRIRCRPGIHTNTHTFDNITSGVDWVLLLLLKPLIASHHLYGCWPGITTIKSDGSNWFSWLHHYIEGVNRVLLATCIMFFIFDQSRIMWKNKQVLNTLSSQNEIHSAQDNWKQHKIVKWGKILFRLSLSNM